jgi:hydroxymethylpyrimidine pyrophosphatase-like HAD family hydrolase
MDFPKLFVTDLDGTALGGGFEPYARFPDPFSEFLDKLQSKGCNWAINTTWDPEGQWQLVLASSVKSRPVYLMGELGYRTARALDEKIEMLQPYNDIMKERLTEVNEELIFPFIKDICGKFTPEKIFFYGHLFQFIATQEDKDKLEKYATEKYSNKEGLEFSCKNGSVSCYPDFLKKSAGLAEVTKLMELKPEEIVIAGDQSPDMTMMEPENLAAHALCPENAADEVKEHVKSIDGAIGDFHSGIGIINAFEKLAKKRGWDW